MIENQDHQWMAWASLASLASPQQRGQLQPPKFHSACEKDFTRGCCKAFGEGTSNLKHVKTHVSSTHNLRDTIYIHLPACVDSGIHDAP